MSNMSNMFNKIGQSLQAIESNNRKIKEIKAVTTQKITELKEDISSHTEIIANFAANLTSIGVISHTEPDLNETLNDTFHKTEGNSLDHCFKDLHPLARWYESDIQFNEYFYKILHNGKAYGRYNKLSNKFSDEVTDEVTDVVYNEVWNKFIELDNSSRKSFDIDEILKPYYTVAKYGDIQKQATVIDQKVRQGNDIDFRQSNTGRTAQDGNIDVNYHIITKVCEEFYLRTKMKNIKVVPYKLNIYHPGDFFSSHKDTPEENLVATAVLLISGQSSSMILDKNYQWNKGNLLIMFPDVIHEVTPVTEYRETITFKVYSTWNPQDLPLDIVDSETKVILKRLESSIKFKSSFVILLQNEYTLENLLNYYQVTNSSDNNFSTSVGLFPYKGVDQKLVEVLTILNTKYTFKIRPIPVIITSYSYEDHDEDSDGENTDRIKIGLPDSDDIQNASKISTLPRRSMKEFDIPESMYDKFTIRDRVNLYTLGYGEQNIGKALFKISEKNTYYGNEYRGTLTSCLYFHYAIVGEVPIHS